MKTLNHSLQFTQIDKLPLKTHNERRGLMQSESVNCGKQDPRVHFFPDILKIFNVIKISENTDIPVVFALVV